MLLWQPSGQSLATPPQLEFWVQRGFDTSEFRRCSTWTATKHIG